MAISSPQDKILELVDAAAQEGDSVSLDEVRHCVFPLSDIDIQAELEGLLEDRAIVMLENGRFRLPYRDEDLG